MEFNEPLRDRKLFIGGLKSCTTNDSLKKCFEQWGEIVDVVVINNYRTQRSRRFGFVTYAQSFMANEAMENKPHIIDGREVDTKRAAAREDIVVNVNKLYISNIKEQSEHDLFEYFGKFGNIINTKIVTDKCSGQRKGFGFIDYEDADSVKKAIFIQTHQVAGGTLFVNKSISRLSDGNGGGLGGHGGGGSGNRRWCGGNRLNKQWDTIAVHLNRSNGSNGGGYGNYEMGGIYRSSGDGGGDGRLVGYDSISGEACQLLSNNNPASVNQSVGYGWGDLQQPSNNWDINKIYGSGGSMESYFTSNYGATPYGNPGAGFVNTGIFGVVNIQLDSTNT